MIKKGFFFILISSLLISCDSNPLDVDTSSIELELNIDRMEQELFESKASTIQETHSSLLEKYGGLYQLFFENMLGEGSVHDPMAATYLEKFVQNEDMQHFYAEMKNKFGNFNNYEEDFTEAFKHYKHYFPDSTIPQIVTFYSNFNANALPTGNRLGIGLDMYLGTENEIVKSIPTETLPQFIKDKMKADYLVADGVKYWLFNRFFDDSGNDFLTEIINAGKIMYLTDAMLPNDKDYIKMGYSKEELQWCIDNEQNIWQTVVDEELLYSKDKKKIAQFTTNGPFTKGLPEDSPAMIGIWLGWQMVRDYVNENNVSVTELLEEKNIRKILKSYKPNE